VLHIIRGTADTARSAFIDERISESIDAGRRTVLFVPEQAAFARERDFLATHGAVKANRLNVTGLSRIIRTLLGEAGLTMSPEVDDAAKFVLMSLAVEEVSAELKLFGTHGSGVNLIRQLIAEYDDIRNSGLTLADIDETVRNLPEGTLRSKLKELSLIFSCYSGHFEDGLSDPGDNIRKTTEYLRQNRFFEGWDVYADDFRSLSAAQTELIKVILLQAENVWISVKRPCTTGEISTVFKHPLEFERTMIEYARANGIEIRIEEDITETDPDLAVLHRGFPAVKEEDILADSLKNPQKITFIEAGDKYRESELVACHIRKLIESGEMRARDIVIVERGSSYALPLESALRKYDIPVFRDRPGELTEFPVIRMLIFAVKLAATGFETETVLNYLKCGLAGLGIDDIGSLEKYAFIWHIDGKQWTEDFAGSPNGYDKSENEDPKALERINRLRKRAIDPLVALRDGLRKESPEESCRAVWDFLENGVYARTRFTEYANELNERGDSQGALACTGVWNSLVSALDALYSSLENRESIQPQRFSELLEILLSGMGADRIPAGIDEVTIGSADRIRYGSPKAVFIVGANEGVFPSVAITSGLFSEMEKKELSLKNFVLETTPESIFDEERLITYSAVTATTDRLFVSWSAMTLTGAELKASEIVSGIKGLFREGIQNAPLPTLQEKICNHRTAFSAFVENIGSETPEEEALREFCEGSDEVSGVTFAIENRRRIDDAARRLEKINRAYEATKYEKQLKDLNDKLKKKKDAKKPKYDEIAELEQQIEELKNDESIRRLRVDKALAEMASGQHFADPAVSDEFFGGDLMFSPSRVEKYYQCPFAYFNNYGLKIRVPQEAKLDNRVRGTFIHYVLEQLLLAHPDKEEFVSLSRKELFAETDSLAKGYIEKQYGGERNKTKTQLREFDNAGVILHDIALRLQSEFAVSGFTYSDMEYEINDRAGEDGHTGTKPYEIELDDGRKIRITGIVDRIDTYTDSETGENYIRIVDYKSGSKEFSIKNLYDGLNLQMPMYLFAVTDKRNEGKYSGVSPAGFLYFRAKSDEALDCKNERNISPEEAEKIKKYMGRQFGCILNEDNVKAAMNDEYVAFLQTDGKDLKDSLATRDEMKDFEDYLCLMIKNMGNDLLGGRIDACPTKGACDYCDYKSICRRESGGKKRELLNGNSNAKKAIREKLGEENNAKENADG